MNVTPGVIASSTEALLTDSFSRTQCAAGIVHNIQHSYGSENALPLNMASLPAPPPSASAHSDLSGVTMTFILAALLLSLLSISQVFASHFYAYTSAPVEIQTFLDAANSSIAENESFDYDIMRLPTHERPRLIKLLDSIQKCGDDLREDLMRLTIEGSDSKLKTQSMLLWKSHRERLEARLRRLDLLHMRFLTLQMGLVVASTSSSTMYHEKAAERRAPPGQFAKPGRPAMPQHALSETIKIISERSQNLPVEKKPTTPQRSMSAARTGHNSNDFAKGPAFSMASVISELQSSPKLHRRRESIERRTSVPMSPTSQGSNRPMSPMSPLGASGNGWRFDDLDT